MVTTSSTNSTKNGNFIKINSYNFYVLEIGPQIGDFVRFSSRQNVSGLVLVEQSFMVLLIP